VRICGGGCIHRGRAEEEEPSEGELLQELREKREWLEETWKEQNAVNLNGDYFVKVLRLLQGAQTTLRNPHRTSTRSERVTERFLQLLS
jgi:hypothetical protein